MRLRCGRLSSFLKGRCCCCCRCRRRRIKSLWGWSQVVRGRRPPYSWRGDGKRKGGAAEMLLSFFSCLSLSFLLLLFFFFFFFIYLLLLLSAYDARWSLPHFRIQVARRIISFPSWCAHISQIISFASSIATCRPARHNEIPFESVAVLCVYIYIYRFQFSFRRRRRRRWRWWIAGENQVIRVMYLREAGGCTTARCHGFFFFSLLPYRRGDGVMDCSAGHQEQKWRNLLGGVLYAMRNDAQLSSGR